MEDIIKNQITLSDFETTGIKYNTKGTKRSYFDVLKHLDEYQNNGMVDKEDFEIIVFEALIDKSAINDFIKILTDNHFEIYNNKDMPYLLNIRNRILKYPKTNKTAADLASIEKTINTYGNKPLYEVNSDDDAIIYFIPFNDKVSTLHDFYKVYRELFFDFAIKNDLTIILRTKNRNNRIDGFFAYNFLDADKDNNVITYKYASRVNFKALSKDSLEFIGECITLNKIGKNKYELDEVNTIISRE